METLAQQLTPRQIVAELDRYIVGQQAAKRAVAVALRNRWRRQQIRGDLRDEVMPKNIIMIGPTGVGKTEIARRLAKLAGAPFVKVEASKFTEVGYVGRDVDSMIRDLADVSVQLVKAEAMERVQGRAEELSEERLLDLLLPPPTENKPRFGFGTPEAAPAPRDTALEESREKFRRMLREGKLEDRQVELDLKERASGTLQVFSNTGLEEMGVNLQEMLGGGRKTKRRKVSIAEARRMLAAEEAERLVDMDAVLREAITRAEEAGIVFIDEIDKVSSRGGANGGPDVSRQGVQRDLLPIVEGSSVTTKYGAVRTDHILFIAAGAFHITKVSDLIPELQGRFPIRVELEPLGRAELERILSEPKNSLIRQYTALLETEGLALEFTPDAVAEIARVAQEANERTENIGARRLHAVVERLLDEVSFDADSLENKQVRVTAELVRERLDQILQSEDLARYIL